MNRLSHLLGMVGIIGIVIFNAPSAGAADEPPRPMKVDNYFQFHDVGDPQINPDGKWVAYTISNSDLETDSFEGRRSRGSDRRREFGGSLRGRPRRPDRSACLTATSASPSLHTGGRQSAAADTHQRQASRQSSAGGGGEHHNADADPVRRKRLERPSH